MVLELHVEKSSVSNLPIGINFNIQCLHDIEIPSRNSDPLFFLAVLLPNLYILKGKEKGNNIYEP